ncbi:MAG: sodium/proline symporter PutP [Clostridia bacterium]|nr:sodium/proline symporter PutP [Clostridia bacterium]
MNAEVIMFIVYLAFMLAIGVWFFFKSKNGGEKTYFLGGRQMGPWVSALSAGASDMSAWVLMGLPGSIFALGLGEVWIAIGLGIGYALSWLYQAPRLRRFSIVANDSITIPQYLTNRFLSKSRALQIICAVVFLVAYTIYAASSIKACGTLFSTVIPSLNETVAMYIAALIIISYTFLGGFSAVCWTDFFQGLLILGAMLIAPIFVLLTGEAISFASISTDVPGFWDLFSNWKSIVSGLAWGLGYFGMPHIIIRFMSLRSQKELRKSAKIGISWTVIILAFAAVIGIVGRAVPDIAGSITTNNELVFINMVRKYFPAILSGILLSAVLAASMSTADSQLLAASSAFASDVYKPIFRKNKASDSEMLWAGRIVVLVISVIAVLIAANPNASSIMGLVSNAWGVFGAAFGPTILLSLFWKRFNFAGAIAGIVVGALVDILWLSFLGGLGIYEILPGFIASLIAAVAVTLATKKPSDEVEQLFDKANSPEFEN